MIGNYLQSQLVFVFIYAIVGVSLLILVGFTGQASLGHAAFLAIGAYTSAWCQQHGVPFVIYFPLARNSHRHRRRAGRHFRRCGCKASTS